MNHHLLRNTLFTACLAGLSTMAAARPGPASGEYPEPPAGHDPATRITHDLQLDDTQAAALREIFEGERAQLEALGAATHEEFCAIHKQARAEVHALLNDEQRAQLADIEARHAQRPSRGQRQTDQEGERGDRRERGPGGWDARRPGPPVCKG